MDARQLEIFLAVLDSPTMTNAAERVHLSTAAVSVQVRTLADELKTDLFTRSGKKLVPTAAARALEQQARHIVNGIRSIRDSFDNRDAMKDGRPFHFATGATTLIYRLAEPLRSLRGKFPNLDLRITVLATEEMVAGVLAGQFDLALISLPFPHPQLRVKCMVEAGFGYSVLPAYALVDSQGFFQTLRIAGHRLVRKQALATSNSNYTRSLTGAVIDFLKRSLDQ
jgi:DNA-binding transcriptional LysR family regulator